MTKRIVICGNPSTLMSEVGRAPAARLRVLAACVCALFASGAFAAAPGANVWRFDCGTADSPLMEGYTRLTAAEQYDPGRGYGWTTPAQSVVFGPQKTYKVPPGSYGRPGELKKHIEASRTALNNDGVVSENDLSFRLDAPKGVYRVSVMIADMSQPIGSMDMCINGVKTNANVTAWTYGSYRLETFSPSGWWVTLRNTVEAKDGHIEVTLKKNQSYYDQQMAEQAKGENPYKQWYHYKPVVPEPPYFFIGMPFVRNSIAAIEVTPCAPGPVVGENEQLKLTAAVQSPALEEAIAKFNAKDFAGSFAALKRVSEPQAQAAKAVVALWLAGRPECEEEKTLVPQAVEILKRATAENPEAYGLAELLQDAGTFEKGLEFHLNRGRMRHVNGKLVQRNHFVENDKAIGQFWTIQEGSPLYYKTQLYIARAGNMLHPYKPTLGTPREIALKLEKKFPENRFVKYLLHYEWAPYGDGTHFDDWVMKDYKPAVKDAPKWVQSLYPAWATMLDWSEWYIKFKQQPEGNIGGGWGDDVEVVAAFGYYGFTTRDTWGIALEGTRRMVEGMWNTSEVDPETGFCLPLADAEHSAEWTGNTLGVMAQIDYGSPVWIERCMKTAKLIRDLWTDYDVNGNRRFRANFFGGTQVGSDDQCNDAWINYRAVRPAATVLRYNRNPVIAKLYIELAESWVKSALSTDRGKPRGVIPSEVSFPGAIIGGLNSPAWWKAYNSPGSINDDWSGGDDGTKQYVQDVLIAAFELTRDPKYLEPMRLEYELAGKYGNEPKIKTGSRLQLPTEWVPKPEKDASNPTASETPGSEAWAGKKMRGGIEQWLTVKPMVEGRKGPLQNDITKDDIVRFSDHTLAHTREHWPMITTEASATDRVAWGGACNAFFFYTGGKWGGATWTAPVTYENTTREFCAAVMANDTQGFRILYYSMAPETREIGILPWALETGARYKLTYGPDANDDGKMDSVAEQREFDLPQSGESIKVRVEPRKVYVIEVDQIKRGKAQELAPDPGLSAEDILYHEEYTLLMARIHNVGAAAARNVEVAFYEGDPAKAGKKIGEALIPCIEAPNDLAPQSTKVGIAWKVPAAGARVFVVVDPDHKIQHEITNFNNVASRIIRPEANAAGARE